MESSGKLERPAPTAWPIILALGIALLFAGLVTSLSISALGAILAVAGCVGWFREVLPREKFESIPLREAATVVATERRGIARVAWLTPELQRARLPLEVYPFSAGVKGGLAGSVAMALLAISYGVFSGHGIWYPINLLAVGFFPERAAPTQISLFHWDISWWPPSSTCCAPSWWDCSSV